MPGRAVIVKQGGNFTKVKDVLASSMGKTKRMEALGKIARSRSASPREKARAKKMMEAGAPKK